MVNGEKPLSPGEEQVLRFAARGYSLRYIAYLRGSKFNTVRVQMANARKKLGAESRAEAIAIARRRWPV